MAFFCKIVIICTIFSCISSDKKFRTVEYPATGKYVWQLAYNIDNLNNSGTITRKVYHEVRKSYSYREYKSQITKTTVTTSLSLVGTVFNIITTLLGGQQVIPIVEHVYKEISDNKVETEEISKQNETWIVGPHSQLRLYRLAFKGPGVSYELEHLFSDPEPMAEVKFDVVVRQYYFLKGINVVYKNKESDPMPAGRMELVKGYTSNINSKNQGKAVYLVPVWTEWHNESVTRVKVLVTSTKDSNRLNLAEGDGTNRFRYLSFERDYSQNERVAEVGLFRDAQELTAERLKPYGYTYFSLNINYGRGAGGYVYIVFKKKSIVHLGYAGDC